MIRVLLIASMLAVAVPAQASGWHSCSQRPPHAGHLEASRLRCANAARAVRAGSFAITPGGPQFSTRGYRCTSPVGPRPGFITCAAGDRRFRFKYR